MRSLLALNVALGVELEHAIRECVHTRTPFCVLDQRVSDEQTKVQLELLGASEILSHEGRSVRRSGRMVDDDIGLVMLTSGSSGAPKAAQLTWSALEASAKLTQSALRAAAPPVWYPCLPANHIGGLAVLLRAIFSDATLGWGDASELAGGASRGATHIAVVRAQLARHDLSAYEKVLLGGARPPTAVGDNVVATWGMTETGSGVVYDGFALAGVDVESIAGEIIVRSPTLFHSYRDSPRPEILGPDGRDDWFPTGDAGDVINGRVTVRGRLGYVINTGGEKLWPEDLETIIASVPGVEDVAVLGVDDPEWGQRVVAFVVGDTSNLDAAIRAILGERVGPWAKPKEIRRVTSILRTSNGKIRRSELHTLL